MEYYPADEVIVPGIEVDFEREKLFLDLGDLGEYIRRSVEFLGVMQKEIRNTKNLIKKPRTDFVSKGRFLHID